MAEPLHGVSFDPPDHALVHNHILVAGCPACRILAARKQVTEIECALWEREF